MVRLSMLISSHFSPYLHRAIRCPLCIRYSTPCVIPRTAFNSAEGDDITFTTIKAVDDNLRAHPIQLDSSTIDTMAKLIKVVKVTPLTWAFEDEIERWAEDVLRFIGNDNGDGR